MLVWLLVLLLLGGVVYALMKFVFFSEKSKLKKKNEHYTFKL